jgi:BirA family biotin operon repressor/biotin-[acetyl-CoA-carboxylase] ligase
LFRPPSEVDPHAVAVTVGVAAVDACRLLGASDVGLKWPNDLIVGDRKMGGMLAESVVRGDRVQAVVVGIGINVKAVELSTEVAETATSLESAGGDADRERLLAAMVPEVQQRYRRLVEGDTVDLRAAWRQRLDTLGRRVRLELDDEVLEGTAVDVDQDGALLVDIDGTIRRVTAADVVHLRPAG